MRQSRGRPLKAAKRKKRKSDNEEEATKLEVVQTPHVEI